MLLISISNFFKVTGQNKEYIIILQLRGGGASSPLQNFEGRENERYWKRKKKSCARKEKQLRVFIWQREKNKEKEKEKEKTVKGWDMGISHQEAVAKTT